MWSQDPQGAVGRQVCSRLAEEGYHVLGLDRRSGISLNPEVTLQTVDLAVADLRTLLTGADIVVHLASGVQAHYDVEEDPGHNMLAVAERLLAAADTAGVTHFVIRSSGNGLRSLGRQSRTLYRRCRNPPMPRFPIRRTPCRS